METTFSEIGPVILKIADTQSDITILTERLHGAHNPSMVDVYAMQLREKQSLLSALRKQRKELRLIELNNLQVRLSKIEHLFENSLDMIEEQDLRDLQHDIRNRIETLQKVIANETE